MSDLEVDSTAMLKNIAYPPCWNWPGSYRLAGKILLPSTPHNHELVARTRLLQVELPQKAPGYPNRPFPSSKNSHFQSEVKCEAIGMKMIFNYDANKTHFHNKGFALSFVLKVRFFWTRKWPNPVRSYLEGVLWGLESGGVVLHGSRELRQSFHESSKILFVAHIVLQNWGVDYFELVFIHKK